MNEALRAAIRSHAQAEFPRECCGVVIVNRGKPVYVPCRNIASTPDAHFTIAPEDYAHAEEVGEIIRIVHSHPGIPPEPSEADKVACEATGMPWIIVNWPTGRIVEFEPSGYKAPLVGRQWVHGVMDCYTLVRDYYAETLGITLVDFPRQEEWWLKGDNLYAEGFAQAGFAEVDELADHDVLLMQIGSPVINHAAIYLGGNKIMQHCMGRLSTVDVYGGGWQRAVRKIVRHKDTC